MGNLFTKFYARMRQMSEDNSAFSSIEVVLLLVVIVALVVIFRDQIQGIIEAAFGAITRDSNSIIN